MIDLPSSLRSVTISQNAGHSPVRPQSLITSSVTEDNNNLHAMRIQRELDGEDYAPSAQCNELFNSAQTYFECSTCIDEVPVESITRIDSCGHTFCSECVRGHILAYLADEEDASPGSCPTCTSIRSKGKGKASGACRL